MSELQRAASALRAINSGCCREEWIRIGMAARSAGLSADDFFSWSEPARNFKSENDCRTTWKSFGESGPVTPATLFAAAIAQGWTDPAKRHHGMNGNGASRPKADRAKAAPKAATQAASMNPSHVWQLCEPATISHAYIAKKCGNATGLRVYPHDAPPINIKGANMAGCLVLPCVSPDDGRLLTLQFIPADGDKLNLPGASFGNGCFVVGDIAESSRVYIVEGLGQAWACWQATGQAAVVTFGAGRMKTLAAVLRAKYPEAVLVLVPDVGKESQAEAIAKDVNGEFVKMPDGWPQNSDVNDLAQRDGTDVLAELLERTKRPPKPETKSNEWPISLDLEVLSEREPELPRFIIQDWLPAGYATLLAGHGGIGKSAIALHLAVCAAAGVSFFGLEVARRRVLYLSCEDRESVLHWRLTRICSHLGIDLAQLHGWLEILDLVGRNSVLFERDPRTGNVLTMAYWALDECMRKHGTELLIVDGISDTFAGNENSRAEAKRFVNGLVALIPPATGAVLLVGHVAKMGSTAGAAGDGYSGSTGWHNSVRARWYLYPEATQDADGENIERTGDLILDLQKSNMGRTDQSMRFAWNQDAHLFVGRIEGGEMAFDRKHRERDEQAGIIASLKSCAEKDVVVPAATTGRRTAFHVLSACPEFPETLRAGKPGVRRFWRILEQLRAMRRVNDESHRTNDRRYIAKLTLTQEEERACGQ